MKYVATIEEQDFVIEVDQSGDVVLDNRPYAVDLESIGMEGLFSLIVDDSSYEIFVERRQQRYYITIKGDRYQVEVQDARLKRLRELGGARHKSPSEATIVAPMPGLVVAVPVKTGEAIKAGDGVVILEAMKMENEIRAPRDGVVKSVRVQAGQTVNQGDVMVQIGEYR